MARPRSAPERPSIDPVDLRDLGPGDAAALVADADLEGLAFDGVSTDVVDLAHARLYESRLSGLRADQVDLGNATLVGCVVERADVPVVRGVRGSWRDVTVRNARLGSAELYESTWRGVDVADCRLGYINLRGATLDDLRFTDCVIDELDLVGATATRVAFHGVRVRRLDVQGSTLRHVDLRGAAIEELSGLGSLAGATISPEQLADLAPALAAHLGITVVG
ncbi:pentapeptide repeat-containing protein [Xylanimonas ulmi]|uniref:Uncharacterized protein YjbI with pentapeptide repeats n=1 Tax=Xylanimonas ulmi TaxID=228973 RepID=A0A4Q7LYC3_9MICO|nr:pentapeptide repeat-containing protein [Xylanibacterium ulmi]RZS60205.1 uncharacterized protein YjbI with pentapeptide repeats [Xylanibacterium ulmi]